MVIFDFTLALETAVVPVAAFLADARFVAVAVFLVVGIAFGLPARTFLAAGFAVAFFAMGLVVVGLVTTFFDTGADVFLTAAFLAGAFAPEVLEGGLAFCQERSKKQLILERTMTNLFRIISSFAGLGWKLHFS